MYIPELRYQLRLEVHFIQVHVCYAFNFKKYIKEMDIHAHRFRKCMCVCVWRGAKLPQSLQANKIITILRNHEIIMGGGGSS